MPPEGTQVFISYARRNEKSQALITQLRRVADEEFYQSGEDQGDGYKPVEIAYDELLLDYGRSIEGFMQQVATSKHLILAISDEYLCSPYCMYECLSAYNAIGNRYHPAIVFVSSEPAAEGAILTFDEAGLPKISKDKLISHWQTRHDALKSDDPARLWYRRYILMAPELTAWMTGRRWAGNPERLIPHYIPGTTDDGVRSYIANALNPPENRIAWPSGDILRERSIARISAILKGQSELEKALNRGDALGGEQYRREFVEKMLDEPAGFVSEQLAPALEQAAGSLNVYRQLNAFRKAADKVFGELVKYGAKVETVHKQLQQLEGKEKQAPIEVASESVLPEMVTARLRDRSGAFREQMNGGKIGYLGRRELVIDGDNILETGETEQDAMEQLSTGFLSRLGQLHYTNDAGRPWQMPGPDVLREELGNSLPQGEFLLKIEGLPPDEAQALMEKLQSNKVLRQLPVFVAADERGNVIKIIGPWYRAIFKYYAVRDQQEA